MPVEVTWDQCKQLISPGGAFSGTADAGGFIEGGEQARLMETCIGEGQVAADTDIDDKKSRRTKNNGTGKGDSLPKPNAAGGGNEGDKDTSGATVATKSTAMENGQTCLKELMKYLKDAALLRLAVGDDCPAAILDPLVEVQKNMQEQYDVIKKLVSSHAQESSLYGGPLAQAKAMIKFYQKKKMFAKAYAGVQSR